MAAFGLHEQIRRYVSREKGQEVESVVLLFAYVLAFPRSRRREDDAARDRGAQGCRAAELDAFHFFRNSSQFRTRLLLHSFPLRIRQRP